MNHRCKYVQQYPERLVRVIRDCSARRWRDHFLCGGSGAKSANGFGHYGDGSDRGCYHRQPAVATETFWRYRIDRHATTWNISGALAVQTSASGLWVKQSFQVFANPVNRALIVFFWVD